MSDKLANIDSLFSAAIDIASEHERAAFVDQCCAGDPEKRRRLETLLRAHFRAGSFLQAPPSVENATEDVPPITETVGAMVGHYKLLQKLGEGGMGTVFVAEQEQPVKRRVALKIIKPGMDSAQVIARFEAERQALALMDHTNIAKVLDAGATDAGHPYFVMELVKGVPITKYCDELNVPIRERLELFMPVCQAIQHAHQKGIIHRDIKPSNVLIAMQDGKPVPKVIDFGVAKALHQKLTDLTLMTEFGAVVGTLEYMSPEQAELSALDIDTRSDVYALGALLYELLTGATPLDRRRLRTIAFDEARRIIRDEEPPKPSTRISKLGATRSAVSAHRKTEPGKLSALLKGDLDWIVMKALEKDRTRRYETASAFAADVQRFLSDELVEARPPSTWYRVRKMVRRNKALATTVALVAATLVVGTVVSLMFALDARHSATVAYQEKEIATLERSRALEQRNLAAKNEHRALESEQSAKDQAKIAEANETKAEWRLYATNIASAQRGWETENPALLYHYLSECRPDFRGWEHDYLYTLANQNQQTLRGHTSVVRSVAYSPNGKRLASAGGLLFDANVKNSVGSGTLKLWDADSGKEIRTFDGHTDMVRSVCFSPDGKRLASASWDKTVKLWDAASGRVVMTLMAHTDGVYCVAFSPDGKRLASASWDKTVKLWDAASGQVIQTLQDHAAVTSVAFSPDGKRLASASADKTIRLWDAASGQPALTLNGHAETVTSVAFSPDGKRLASGSVDKTVKLWDAATGQVVLTLTAHAAAVTCVSFNPDGNHLASASSDRTVRLWDAASGKEVFTYRGHTSFVFSVAFSPDGRRLASASNDKMVKLWDAASRPEVLTLKGHTDFVYSVAFSPDGNRLVSGSRDKTVKLWDAASGAEVRVLEGHTAGVHCVTFSPDGKRLASASYDNTLKLWDVASGMEIMTLKWHTAHVTSVAFSPDGKLLASASFDKSIKLWNAASGEEIRTCQGHTDVVWSVAFSPDGKLLASGSADKTVKLWDLAGGQGVRTIQGHSDVVAMLAFSPDGERLATASVDKTVKLWDIASGRQIMTFRGHAGSVHSVAFSPDGKRLASGSNNIDKAGWGRASGSIDTTVKLWDTASGQEVLSLTGYSGIVESVPFSPDGKRLASTNQLDFSIMIHDASKSMKEMEQK